MSGESRLGEGGGHWVLNTAKNVLSAIGPMARLLQKDVINPPEVPGKVIAGLLRRDADGRTDAKGKYFVLDNEKSSSSLSLDINEQEKVWARVCRDLDLEVDI